MLVFKSTDTTYKVFSCQNNNAIKIIALSQDRQTRHPMKLIILYEKDKLKTCALKF